MGIRMRKYCPLCAKMYRREHLSWKMALNLRINVSARAHAQLWMWTLICMYHMKETSRKLCYIFRNCHKIWIELSGWKGSVTYGLGADLSLPQCLSVTTGIWNLTHKSDLRAEISGSIVRYDALAQRPEVLLSWYSVCACAVALRQKFYHIHGKKYVRRVR